MLSVMTFQSSDSLDPLVVKPATERTEDTLSRTQEAWNITTTVLRMCHISTTWWKSNDLSFYSCDINSFPEKLCANVIESARFAITTRVGVMLEAEGLYVRGLIRTH